MVGRGHCGDVPKPGKATLEYGSHDTAGDHDIRVGQAVPDLAAVPLRLDHACGPQDGELLRDARLGCPDYRREAAHLNRASCNDMEDLEPTRAGEGLEDRGLQDRDLVH